MTEYINNFEKMRRTEMELMAQPEGNIVDLLD
jgi:hypothetical protein